MLFPIYGRLTAACPFTGPDMKPRVFPTGTVVVAEYFRGLRTQRWYNVKVVDDSLFENPTMKAERVVRLSPLEMLALAPDLPDEADL